jgi:hypothetical protein
VYSEAVAKTAIAFDVGAIESEKCRAQTAEEFLRSENRARDDHHETDQLDERSQPVLPTHAQVIPRVVSETSTIGR